MRNGTVLNVAAFTMDFSRPMQPVGPRSDWTNWVGPATKEELVASFEGFGPDAQRILQCMDMPSRWAVHGLYPPLRSFVNGSVVLIGDAVSCTKSQLNEEG